MLVLSRNKNQTIMIGDDIEVTIVDVKGESVRVGIRAPRSVPVHRKEVYEAIQKENVAAAQAGGATAQRLEEAADLFGEMSRKKEEKQTGADAASSQEPGA